VPVLSNVHAGCGAVCCDLLDFLRTRKDANLTPPSDFAITAHTGFAQKIWQEDQRTNPIAIYNRTTSLMRIVMSEITPLE